MTRYAVYFAPAPDSTWWDAGCRWLGRDPAGGATLAQPALAALASATLASLTADARRYGFHATLKAPFHLKSGFDESHLGGLARAFCAIEQPLTLPDLRVGRLGNFLALRPSAPLPALDALARRCVEVFDVVRAPLTTEEWMRRQRSELSARQQALLGRWGYPYTEEEFRFHLTLTDSVAALDSSQIEAIRAAAEAHFAPAILGAPPAVDGLTIFREERPGAPFIVWRRIPFELTPAACAPRSRLRLDELVGGPQAARGIHLFR